MSADTKCRKRVRSVSNGCIFTNQNKYFINQQIIDQNDANKMKEIHGEFGDNSTNRVHVTDVTVFFFFSFARQNHKIAIQECQCESTNRGRRAQSEAE